MSSCPSCLRAQQVATHADYLPGCIGCGARRLAHMPQQEREKALDAIQHVSGWEMRCEATQLMRAEMARIKRLRDARAGRTRQGENS